MSTHTLPRVARDARLVQRVGATGTALLTLAAVVAYARYLQLGAVLPLLLVGGVAAVLVFAAWPALAALALLALWCTVLDPYWATTSVGPLTMSMAQLVLMATLAAVVLRRLAGQRVREPSVFSVPVAAFLATVVFGTLVGIVKGEPAGVALFTLRAMLALAAFYVLREAFVGRAQTLVRLLVAVAFAGTALAVIGVATGVPIGGTTIDYVITGGVMQDVTRVDPPVLRLVSVVLIIVLARGVFRDRPLTRLGILLVFAVLELMSFTRSTWTPLLLLALVVPALLTTRTRWVVLGERVLLLAVVGTLGLSLAATGHLGSTGVSLYERAASTTDSSTLEDSSLQDREKELDAAIPQIAAHPVTGIGLNRPYGAVNEGYDAQLNRTVIESRTFIHNTFVGVWLWLGLPGLLAVLWLSTRIARVSRQAYAHRHEPGAGTALACGLGLAALAVQSTFQTNLFYPPALLAVAAGLAYLDIWAGSLSVRSGASCSHHRSATTTEKPPGYGSDRKR